MSASNIDRFNQYAAFFLATLYERFPERCILDCHEAVYGTPLSNDVVTTDMLQRATTDDEIRFCSHALEWLLTTGYFSGQPCLHNVQVTDAVLTAKGFEALNAMPSSLTGQGTLGQQLVGLAKQGAKETARATLTSVVGQVVGAAVRGYLTGSNS